MFHLLKFINLVFLMIYGIWWIMVKWIVVMKIQPSTCLNDWRKPRKNLSQVGRHRDLNPGHPECESRALPRSHLARYVQDCFCCYVIKSAREAANKVLLFVLWNPLLIEINLSRIRTLDIKREKVCVMCPYLLFSKWWGRYVANVIVGALSTDFFLIGCL